MDLDEIKQILEMMREHDLAEFELEPTTSSSGCARTRRRSGPAQVPQCLPWPTRHCRCCTGGGAGAPAGDPVLTAANEDIDLAIVKSPIVGTFYRSPEPGAKPFAEVGQHGEKGQVALHHRGDEADERDQRRMRWRSREGLRGERPGRRRYGERLFADQAGS